MAVTVPASFYAPAGRASMDAIDGLCNVIQLEKFLPEMLEAIPDYAMILNAERQVIAANSRLLRDLGLTRSNVLGKRPGEIFSCINAHEGPDGCTTGRHCARCGAAFAVVESRLTDRQVSSDCRVTVQNDCRTVCLDLEVTATPMVVTGNSITVCVMKDISAQKRRAVLERIFFHDLLNTAGGIAGLAEVIAGGESPEEEESYKHWLVELAGKLVDEIRYQQKLVAAEKGELKLDLGTVSLPALMEEVYLLYANHEVARGRHLVLNQVPAITILSDVFILRRILGNMVKNALEAVGSGETVTMGCECDADEIRFLVHNPGLIPEEVQLQLFQRSFSTKGIGGRGIGTYSMKLLGEQYLKGRVAFASRQPEGTTFTFTLFQELSQKS